MVKHNTPGQPKAPTPTQRWEWVHAVTIKDRLKPTQTAVLAAHAYNWGPSSFRSDAKIGRMAGVSRQTANVTNKELVKRGLLTVAGTKHRTRLYLVNFPTDMSGFLTLHGLTAVFEERVKKADTILSNIPTLSCQESRHKGGRGRETGNEDIYPTPPTTPAREDPKAVALRIAAEYMSEGRGLRA